MYYELTDDQYDTLISVLNEAKQTIASLRVDKARLEQDVVELKQQVEKWENRYVGLVRRLGVIIED